MPEIVHTIAVVLVDESTEPDDAYTPEEMASRLREELYYSFKHENVRVDSIEIIDRSRVVIQKEA